MTARPDFAAMALHEVALNCAHGRWVGQAQFAACVPCIATALARAWDARGEADAPVVEASERVEGIFAAHADVPELLASADLPAEFFDAMGDLAEALAAIRAANASGAGGEGRDG